MKIVQCIILIIFSSLAFNTQAQSTIGVKLGYTNAWPEYGDIELPADANTHIDGYNFAFFYTYNFWGNAKIGVAPGYIKRGAACFPGWQPTFVGDSKVYLNYLEMPIKLSNTFNLAKSKINAEIAIGYGINLLTSAYLHEESIGTDMPTNISKIEVHNTDQGTFNPIDHGAYLDISLYYPITEQYSAFIQSSYYHGMTDYDKENVSKNRSLSFDLGLAYRL